MWNLNALAEKAKEAAARIEKQLDDSVGLDAGAGGAAPSTAASSAVSLSVAQEDDLNDDDDFFSDSHNNTQPLPSHQASGSWEVQQQQDVAPKKEDSPPVASKLDVTVDEGDDFFGDEIPSPVEQTAAPEIIANGDEEVDFGGDDMGGDGWDEADDIPLDDDEEVISPAPQPEEVEEARPEEPITSPEPEQAVATDMPSEEQGANQVAEPLPEIPKEDFYQPYEPRNDVAETIVQLPPAPPPEDVDLKVNEVEQETLVKPKDIVSESNAFDAGINGSQNDCAMTTEVVSQDHLQNDMPSAPASIAPQPQIPSMDDTERQQLLATIAELESQLHQREDQLASKSDQITSLTLQNETEIGNLRQVISETKEEAKKRIMRAKERVEEMQTKLSEAVRRADAAGGSSQEQSDLVAALRAEGENLARKQSQMEQSVRNARGEARDLQEKLDIEKDARQKEEAKVSSLEKEVKSVKEDLSSARKGETLSKKLEGELVAAKEESEKQRASNLGLEQQLKELKEENKTLKKEVDDARAGAATQLEGESNKLRKERDEMLGDLESKLRTSEREANVREDALRHEVSELRKRWQDAVRRAEDLSMDVQHSTAPLLRQLESTERQNRARATAWAELETKLRSDLEEHVIQLEKLTKERNDLVASDKRAQRLLKEKEGEVTSSQETIDALSSTIESLETKVEELEEECKKVKQELVVSERKASEGATKVRTEMMQTVVDSEERYRSQIEALEEELDGEKQRRDNLEKQLDKLAESMAATEFAQPSPAREKKLRSADNQASILQDTLVGIDSDVDDDEDEADEDEIDQVQGQGSFAAVEQLSLGLKGAKVELEALRKQLASSEETRESLVEELGTARQAVEKLPLFEQKVSDLTMEVKLKDMEIKGLQDDIADVRFLYRTQLDALLEEKAATPNPSMHSAPPPTTQMSSLSADPNPVLRIDE